MMCQTIDLKTALPALIARYQGKLPVVEAICSGKLPIEHLRAIGARQYAEAKAALQVKFAERLRICPISAATARRYWCQQLTDESGNFEPGHDHATLLAPSCLAVGVTPEQLEAEYQRYLPRVDYLCKSPVSLELTLREGAQVYVEEAVFVGTANRIGDALRDHYGVPEEAVLYFRLHAEVDVGHSAAGLEMLAHCAQSEAHKQLVVETAERSLEHFPIWAEDLSG